jgi:peptide/nickel transport system permease protein
VSELVLERLTVTVPLAFMAMVLTTVLALAAGIYAAARHNKLGDVGVMGLARRWALPFPTSGLPSC